MNFQKDIPFTSYLFEDSLILNKFECKYVYDFNLIIFKKKTEIFVNLPCYLLSAKLEHLFVKYLKTCLDQKTSS